MATSENGVKLPLRWRMKHVSSSNTNVPARPGLYAIGHDEACLGLEVGRVYVYIGMTENLRRRLEEHTPLNEQKSGLKKYLRTMGAEAKCWYAVADTGELKESERVLIRKFRPRFNILGKH